MQSIYKFRPFEVIDVEPIGENCPVPRSGHRIVADKGNVYSFGGFNPQTVIDPNEIDGFIFVDSCVLFRELWKFNFASRKWTKLKTKGDIPEELASHSALLYGGHLLVFGGTGYPFGSKNSNSVHMCNLKTLVWFKVKASGTPPLEQYGQAITLHEDKLFVIGGTTGFSYSITIHRLDFKTLEWSQMETSLYPEPRYRHEITFHNNGLFMFGGGTDVESYGFNKVPVFRLENQVWENVVTSEEVPQSRLCHSCVKMDDSVYIFGGHNHERILSDVWRISLKSLQWEKLPWTLLQPVCFHSAALSDQGQMFSFGGVTDFVESRRTNKLYSVWLKIPSLEEICWQAILHYMPHISHLSKDDLVDIGIPWHLFERIDFQSRV